jgi:serine/threonine protein kinase
MNEFRVITSWTNGRKAIVHLVENNRGEKSILKIYRPGFTLTMLREYLVTRYIASRVPLAPKVLGLRPLRKELLLSYVSGQRVLEWVLERFGDAGLSLQDFQSFHGLDPDHPNPVVAAAFERFRRSTSEDAQQLKQAIRASYAALHRIGMLHGSPDPRNIIYGDGRVSIIDFDHARPCLDPAKIDYRSLTYWYGLAPNDSGDHVSRRTVAVGDTQ